MSWVGGVQLEGVDIVYVLMGIHIRKTLLVYERIETKAGKTEC